MFPALQYVGIREKAHDFSIFSQQRQALIDFSGMTKEDVFFSIYDSYHTGIFPEKYRDFYSLCKQLMIKEYDNGKNAHATKDEIENSMLRGNLYIEDFTLGGWIVSKFEITRLGGDALIDFKIYLVRDIAKNRERLVWKRFDKIDKEGNIITNYPVYEASLPVGYFAKVQAEFVEAASKEIEEALEKSNEAP